MLASFSTNRTCAHHLHQLDLSSSATSSLLLLLRLARSSSGLGDPKAHAVTTQQAGVAIRLRQISASERQPAKNKKQNGIGSGCQIQHKTSSAKPMNKTQKS
jgi:hypothetical protein